ncbi:cytochrome P450 [Aspergillus insuetus]
MELSSARAEMLHLSVKVATALILIYTASVLIYNGYFHPLRRFPGPPLAAFTSLWYFKRIRTGNPRDVQHPLHEKFGDFVRIGPKILAVRHPDAIETIFGTKKDSGSSVWRKAAFYDSFDPHIPNARTDSFSERDDARNAERRRLVGSLYAQGNVLRYEACVDRLIDIFQQRMKVLADPVAGPDADSTQRARTALDMSVWLERYTFDVIGAVFHGRLEGFGMLRQGADYNGWCYLMGVMPDIGAAVSYLPWGLRSLYMLSQLVFQSSRDGLRGMLDVTRQAERATHERWEQMQRKKGTGISSETDILTGLLEMVQQQTNEDRTSTSKTSWTIADVVTEVWAVIWAGSDTTATALTSIFYHVHKHPQALAKLRAEIDGAFEDGRLQFPIRYSDARKLPYLHAVILESMRVHPSIGIGLPREVPPGGAKIGGTFIPGGIEVIVNPAAIHHDERCFGPDAREWVPERWLSSDTEAVRQMQRFMMHFGHGPRMLVDRWELQGSWFHRAGNVQCTVKTRKFT